MLTSDESSDSLFSGVGRWEETGGDSGGINRCDCETTVVSCIWWQYSLNAWARWLTFQPESNLCISWAYIEILKSYKECIRIDSKVLNLKMYWTFIDKTITTV